MTQSLQKKVEQAIAFLKSVKKNCNHELDPPEIAYSGGKDSDVILELAKMADIYLYFPIYKNTTIDPPGTIQHVKEMGVEIRNPKITFLELISKYGFPSPSRRFCCAYLKEYQINKHVILGIRRQESGKRKHRYKEPQQCRIDKKLKIDVRQYFPILEWTNEDIAEFVEERKIKCHPLYYDENGVFHPERRLGCMCCPLISKKKRIEQFKKYPNMIKLYAKGGIKYLENKNHSVFGKNVYEWMCYDIFCRDMEDFRQNFVNKNSIFSDVIDCKTYIENYFNINLP